MKTPGKLSSCLWERSTEFQGKTESKPQRKDKGERVTAGPDGKTDRNTEQTRLVDVWRFLGVAESIRPSLFLVIPLFFPSVCPGAVRRRYNTYAGRAQQQQTGLISLVLAHLSSSIFPGSFASLLFSLSSSVSLHPQLKPLSYSTLSFQADSIISQFFLLSFCKTFSLWHPEFVFLIFIYLFCNYFYPLGLHLLELNIYIKIIIKS